eukprot:gene4787-12527_t
MAVAREVRKVYTLLALCVFVMVGWQLKIRGSKPNYSYLELSEIRARADGKGSAGPGGRETMVNSLDDLGQLAAGPGVDKAASASASTLGQLKSETEHSSRIEGGGEEKQEAAKDKGGIKLHEYKGEYKVGNFDPTVKGALNITYESCMASLKGTDRTKTLKRPLHWIHFPKCGTSFGAVVYGYACQSNTSPHEAPASTSMFADTNKHNLVKADVCDYCGEKAVTQNKPTLWDPQLRKQLPFRHTTPEHPPLKYCDWSVPPPWFPMSNHFPHTWNWETKNYRRAPIALFRDPRRRIVSAWNNNKHSFGVGTFNNPHNKSYARQLVNDLKTVQEFSKHPPIQSCQTKMMLGEYCGEILNITQAMKEEAVRRTLNLEFVGLTDAFNASVCLFHHQFGGTPEEWMFQSVGGVRSGVHLFDNHGTGKVEKFPGKGARVHPDTWKEIPTTDDSLDFEIYELAKRLFVSRLQKFGLWHPDYFKMKIVCRGKKSSLHGWVKVPNLVFTFIFVQLDTAFVFSGFLFLFSA